MFKFTRARSFRVAKRKSKPHYPSTTASEASDPLYLADVEKRAASSSDDDLDYEDSSSASSRATSRSHEPMLAPPPPPFYRANSTQRKRLLQIDRLPRHRFHRYFTLALGTTLVLFVLYLTTAHHRSAQALEALRKRPPPSPVWEGFPFLKRYHGGIRTLVSRAENVPEYPSEVEDVLESLKSKGVERETQERTGVTASSTLRKSRPYDPLKSQSAESAAIVECFLDEDSQVRIPKLQVYDGVVKGFPDHVTGSYDILGLDNSVCFERFGRLGPYGLGYSRELGGSGAGMEGDLEGSERVWHENSEVDYRGVSWADAQERCAAANAHRFKGRNDTVDLPPFAGAQVKSGASADSASETASASSVSLTDASSSQTASSLNRTVVLLRTWADYKYDAEDIMNLRALVSELSLASGGEYTIHFLVHVLNNDVQIWSDKATHDRVLAESLPAEFRGMATLWSERQMSLIYGGMPESNYVNMFVHSNYRSTFQPVQYFAKGHPEYDFFINWEMDVRYTGHYYHLFDKVTSWAKKQPRKGLWERNARFYVPTEHGDWEDFKQMVRVQTEHGTNSKNNIYAKASQIGPHVDGLDSARHAVEKPVWGALSSEWDDIDHENDPKPPTTYDKDRYDWGVGEEADLIVFNPIFDPQDTEWGLAEDVTGYNTTSGLPPRRAAIITASRMSKRLLLTMHDETALKRHSMFSEMWPASCALHHGFKAVYAPHPVFIDRKWPTDYLAAVFNGGRNGATGGARSTPFNDRNQHNFLGITWYYNAGAPENLWTRWFGYKVNNDGGEVYEAANEGRMCLPAMLLHPVKQVNVVYEHREIE